MLKSQRIVACINSIIVLFKCDGNKSTVRVSLSIYPHGLPNVS